MQDCSAPELVLQGNCASGGVSVGLHSNKRFHLLLLCRWILLSLLVWCCRCYLLLCVVGLLVLLKPHRGCVDPLLPLSWFLESVPLSVTAFAAVAA